VERTHIIIIIIIRLLPLKNSVRTAKKTQHFTITKINWLTLFKEIIAVYSEKDTKQTRTNCIALLIVKAGGTHCYHWDVKG
jgi:hypothetical protein